MIGAPIDEIDTPALVVDLDAFEHNLAQHGGLRQGGRRAAAAARQDPQMPRRSRAADRRRRRRPVLPEGRRGRGAGARRRTRRARQQRGGGRCASCDRLAALAREATHRRSASTIRTRSTPPRAPPRGGRELGGTGRDRRRHAALRRRYAGGGGRNSRSASPSAGSRVPRPAGLSRHRPAPAEPGRARGGHRRARRRPSARRSTALEAAGLPCEIVSAVRAPAPSASRAASGVWNELQVGLVPLHGHRLRAHRQATDGPRYDEFRHSLFVLATVMSAPTRDARRRRCRAQVLQRREGRAAGCTAATASTVTGMSDEHGKIEIAPGRRAACASATRSCSSRATAIPTINLHDWYVGVRDGRVESLWPITARGASTGERRAATDARLKLTLAQLEALFWIARLGSVRAAATRLSHHAAGAVAADHGSSRRRWASALLNRESYRATLTTLGRRSRPAGRAHAGARRAHRRPQHSGRATSAA